MVVARVRRALVVFVVAVLAIGAGWVDTASAASPDLGPFHNADELVRREFNDFLSRPPTASEVSTWTAKVNAGTNAGTVVQGISALPGGADTFGPISRLYRAYFLRIPDQGGMTYWIGKRRAGTTVYSVSNQFAHAQEFIDRYGNLSNSGFVQLVYNNVLNRAPDAGGLKYWTDKLNAGQTRGWVMVGFSESNEYITKTAVTTQTEQLYSSMLNRMPTTSEETAATNQTAAALARQLLFGRAYAVRVGITSWAIPMSNPGLTIVDSAGTFAYTTNTSANQVEVIDIAAHRIVAHIPVGSTPYGLDFSPNGKTLYVANSGGSNVSVVDVATRKELRRITIPPDDFENDRPNTIAIAANGKALIATTFNGSGFGGRLMELDLATETVTVAPGGGINGHVTEYVPMKASGDRSKIFFALGDDSGGPIFSYTSATDTFSKMVDLNGFIDSVAVDKTGSNVVWNIYNNSVVTDGNLARQGTITGGTHSGTGISADGKTGYRAEEPGVIRYVNVTRFTTGSAMNLADTIDITTYPIVALSSTLGQAVVQTENGLVITFLPLG